MAYLPAFSTFNRAFPVMSQGVPQNSEQVPEPRRPSTQVKNSQQTTVILLRHGMTDWNQEGRVQGGLDRSRLNNTGLKQARRAGLHLRNIPIETILCSPLRRAKETFQLLAESSANPDLLARKPDFLPDLMEFQVPWQGSLIRELTKGPFKREYTQYRKNPLRFSYHGFNPIRDITRRAEQVWETIGRSQAGSYLVISHNQMNKALISKALEMPTNLSTWNQSNCCFNVFLLEDGKPARLRLCNGSELHHHATISHRSRPKTRELRLLLHLQGHIDGLLKETSGQTISHICYIGRQPSEDLQASSEEANGVSCAIVTLPDNNAQEDIFFSCRDVLDGIRTQHPDGYVVVSAENATVHNALIASCLGLGHEDITKFHSDPGGVTIIDVDSSVEIGLGSATVECHNNYAYRNDLGGFLLGYTSSR